MRYIERIDVIYIVSSDLWYFNRGIISITMDIADLTEEQVQLAIKLAEILSLEDIKESISILSGFDWNLGVMFLSSREFLAPLISMKAR